MELLPPNRADYPLRRRTPQPRYHRQRGSRRGALPRPRHSCRGSTPRVVAGQRPHAEIGAIASNLSHRGCSLRGVPLSSFAPFCPAVTTTSGRFAPATSEKMSSAFFLCGSIPTQSLCSGRCLSAIQVEPSASFILQSSGYTFAV